MRLMIAAIAAGLLLLPAASASAAAPGLHKSQATDFSAAKKKKHARKHGKRQKAPKVEYMRAAPSK